MAENKKDKLVVDSKDIPLSWKTAENLPTIYANQLLISHTGPEFYLIFGEVITPAIQGKVDKTIPEKLEVEPVLKISIPHSMMGEISELIKSNYETFKSKQRAISKEEINDW